MKNTILKILFAFTLCSALGGTAVAAEMEQQREYEREKARSLNFQRMLALEEKRTGQLDVEIKRVQKDRSEMEARNRELSAEVQKLREQCQPNHKN